MTANKPVLTKEDFVRRYQAGEFGNHAPTWDSINDWAQAQFIYRGCFDKKFHLRNRIAGGPTYYNLGCLELTSYLTNLRSHTNWYVSEMAPTEQTLIQGELQLSCNHYDLFYSTVAKPMRASLLEGGKHVTGLLAKALLQKFMTPSDYDWVQELLTNYPDHVIEFSCYSTCWGTIPNSNTVIWEVRNGY